MFLVPNRSELMWIIGLGTGWKIVNNEEVQAIPPKMLEFLNKELDKALADK